MTSVLSSSTAFPSGHQQEASEKILVRLISPIGEEFHYRLAPASTILELKKQIQQAKPHLKPEKLFFFHELKVVSNDTKIEDIDYTLNSGPVSKISELSASNGLVDHATSSATTRRPRSVALLYAFDYLGRWSSMSARQREFR
jgi:hypothetical protein